MEMTGCSRPQYHPTVRAKTKQYQSNQAATPCKSLTILPGVIVMAMSCCNVLRQGQESKSKVRAKPRLLGSNT